MTKRRKFLLWVGLIVSLPATGYAGMSVVFYAWLEASRQWPTEKAAVWTYSALALTVLFLGFFIYCVVALVKEANRQYKKESHSKPTA